MGNLVIATPELVDAATLAAGSEAAGMGVANLQSDQPSERWRSGSLSASPAPSVYIEADLGGPQAIDTVILHGHNLTSAATWRIRGATSQANLTAAPGYDSRPAGSPATDISAWPASGRPTTSGAKGWPGPLFSLLWLGDGGAGAQNFRWWRVDLEDAANPDDYIQAGRLIVDGAWQPSRDMHFDAAAFIVDPSPREETVGGQIHAVARPRRRSWAFSLFALGEDELYADGFDLAMRRGQATPLFLIRDPQATTHLHRQALYGLVTSIQTFTERESDLYQASYALEEML